MRGIIGYSGQRNALPILIEGLKRLEYKGYEATGIAYQNGKGIETCGTPGGALKLQMALPSPLPDARVGIGYAEWTTSSGPSSGNALSDPEKGIFVLHTGLIENLGQLKDRHPATSGSARGVLTGKEVLSGLLLDSVGRGLSPLDAIRELVGMLKGRYALAILFRTSPGTIHLVNNGSALVTALGRNEVFFASDILYLFPHTRESIPLEDGRIYSLRPGGLEISPLISQPAACGSDKPARAGGGISCTSKKNYRHHLLKEIHEQPEAVLDTLSDWVDDPGRLLGGSAGRGINNVRRLHIVGCGTSYNVGLVGRYIIEKFVHIPVNVDISSEYRYMSPNITKGTYFIAISKSGETADTIEAQRHARQQGAVVVAVCNEAGSTSTREADSVLYTRAGKEKGGVSTKVFSSQLAALCLLALALGIKKGTLQETEIETLKSLLLNLPALIGHVLKTDKKISDIAATLADSKGLVYLGRGINYPVAIEGALKMKELSHIHAEAYPIGEEGSVSPAHIGHGTPVVFLAPLESLDDKILRQMVKVRAAGGRVIVITDSPASITGLADDLVVIPSIHPALLPFVTVVPLQLLAYHTANAIGCDIDRPAS